MIIYTHTQKLFHSEERPTSHSLETKPDDEEGEDENLQPYSIAASSSLFSLPNKIKYSQNQSINPSN